jgi:hypothetical protein
MALPLKPYKLKPGCTHWVPNPDHDPESESPETSHLEAKEGDTVYLTDAQFATFKDKFTPVSSASSEVRDQDDEKLTTAKQTAACTGTSVNPNVAPSPPA